MMLDENGELIVTQMTSGIIQGDELSMLFFGLYTGMILKELDGEEDDGFFAKRSSKYADDMCQADTFDLNAKKFEQLRQRLEQDGMKFSLAKCCLYMPFADLETVKLCATQIGIGYIEPDQGITITGVPVSLSPAWVQEQLDSMTDEFLGNMRTAIEHLAPSSVQCVFQILTKLPAARFQHILAANPPEITDDLSSKVDFATNHFVMEFLFPNLDVDEWGELIKKRFALPTAMGGFGKLSLLDRGPCAYWITIEKNLAPLLECVPNFRETNMYKACQDIKETIIPDEFLQRDTNMPFTMRALMYCILKTKANKFLEDAPLLMKKCMVACQAPGAMLSLVARPDRKETRLNNFDFLLDMYTKTGVPLEHIVKDVNGAKPACSLCGEAITLFEHHAVACPSGRITAHDFLVHMLMQICKDAGASAQKERIIGIGQQRADIKLSAAAMDDPDGKGAIVDVTRIASFTHESTQIQDNSKIFAAAESYKKNKYQEASAYENAVTYPFVMTRFGGLGNDAKKFLRRMKAVALAKGRYRPGIDQECIKKWRENIACSVARANALNVHVVTKRILAHA